MNTYEKWSLVISGLGFLLVVVSLSLLIYQTKLLAKSVDATANASAGNRQMEADKVFVDRPELVKYFFKNVDISGDSKDYDAALAVALLLANFYDTYFLQKGQLQQMYTEEIWECYIMDQLARSPLLRRHIEEFPGWYTPELAKCLRK